MKTVLIPVVFLLLISCSSRQASDGPLKMSAPRGWNLAFTEQGAGSQFYSIKCISDPKSFLMLSRWPAGGKAAQIPSLINALAQQFAEQAKQEPTLSGFNATPTKGKISGSFVFGEFVAFAIKPPETIQTLFVLSVDDTLWNGQYSGSESGWKEMLETLTSLAKH